MTKAINEISTIICEQYEPPTHSYIPDELRAIVGVTQDPEIQMLPIDGEKLASHHPAVVAKIGEEIVGYCAGTYTYKQPGIDLIEVGSLVVLPDYRRHGVAQLLVDAVTSQVHDTGHDAVAFCNPASAGIFEKAGYYIAEANEVPSTALEPCESCPMSALHAGKLCCDEVFIKHRDA